MRLKDKVAEAVNDACKGRSDDNTDGHIDNVAARDKLLEFFGYFFHINLLSVSFRHNYSIYDRLLQYVYPD